MPAVLSHTVDEVSVVTLNRPHRLNAIDTGLVRELNVALRAAHADPRTRAMVLAGAGRAFCAGDDLKEFEGQSRSPEAARLHLEAIQDVTRAIMGGPKTVVCAARGWAAGGGFEWLLNCDLVVMGEGTRCFFPEVSLGFIVTGGVTAILQRLVGPQRARAMILFGEHLEAARALELGIATELAPDDEVDAVALAMAQRVATLPPGAVAALKRVMTRAPWLDLESVLALETDAVVGGFVDPETTARVAASVPRRTTPQP